MDGTIDEAKVFKNLKKTDKWTFEIKTTGGWFEVTVTSDMTVTAVAGITNIYTESAGGKTYYIVRAKADINANPAKSKPYSAKFKLEVPAS